MIELVETLPSLIRPDHAEPVPQQLLGSKIIRVGTLPPKHHVDGGGLVIEYRPKKTSQLRRMILAFTEEGMWVYSDQPIPA